MLFGPRLRKLFAFGSRAGGRPRADSDLDIGVWLDGPIRRRDSWVPWIAEFVDMDPMLDPTFITAASLETPSSWLLEAVHGGIEIWFDPTGQLAGRVAAIRAAIEAGAYRRQLFMGLPYYARATS